MKPFRTGAQPSDRVPQEAGRQGAPRAHAGPLRDHPAQLRRAQVRDPQRQGLPPGGDYRGHGRPQARRVFTVRFSFPPATTGSPCAAEDEVVARLGKMMRVQSHGVESAR